MKLRSTVFYSIHANRRKELLTVDIDADTSEEVVTAIQELFMGRWEPPKDANGRFKKGIPYTFVKILRCNKSIHQSATLTHGNIYNYSPTQVMEKIRETFK